MKSLRVFAVLEYIQSFAGKSWELVSESILRNAAAEVAAEARVQQLCDSCFTKHRRDMETICRLEEQSENYKKNAEAYKMQSEWLAEQLAIEQQLDAGAKEKEKSGFCSWIRSWCRK